MAFNATASTLMSSAATMVRLKDLATFLGLSITQVSRALGDKDDVSKETKERVRVAARAMNYQPSAAARMLRKRKADAVAVVLPSRGSQLGLATVVGLLADVAKALALQDLDLVVVPSFDPTSEMAQLRRMVEERRADAFLIVRTQCNDERVAMLAERGVPFVTHGRTLDGVEHAYVDGDGEAGFHAATKMLLALGHRDIAHIAGPAGTSFSQFRRDGWRRAMHEAGLDDGVCEVEALPNEGAGRKAATRLLEQRKRPSALLCATDSIAIGAMLAVRDAGLITGRDIAIVGHDGLPVGEYLSPALTTMKIDADDVGKRLADMLVKRMGGVDARDLRELLPVRQIARESHGPATRQFTERTSSGEAVGSAANRGRKSR